MEMNTDKSTIEVEPSIAETLRECYEQRIQRLGIIETSPEAAEDHKQSQEMYIHEGKIYYGQEAKEVKQKKLMEELQEKIETQKKLLIENCKKLQENKEKQLKERKEEIKEELEQLGVEPKVYEDLFPDIKEDGPGFLKMNNEPKHEFESYAQEGKQLVDQVEQYFADNILPST